MKLTKQMLGLISGIAVFAGFLTGCGNMDREQAQGTQTSQETETDDVQTKKHESITITSYNSMIAEEFFDAFHEAYPEVNLKVLSYGGLNGSFYAMRSLENGDIPDIYLSTRNFAKQAQEKYLLDLSNYDFINNYASTILDSQDVNGSIYLLPSGYQLTGIYYNKTILKENGWEVPDSFEELEALSEKIEAAGYQTMGHGMILDGFPFNYFFNIGNTGYFSTPEGTAWKEKFPKGEAKAAGNSGLEKSARYFQRWVDSGFITTEHMEDEQFYNGESVFFLCLGLNHYTYTTEDGKAYEFGTIPWLSEDGSRNMVTRSVSKYVGINRRLAEEGNEQKLEDALKFMEFISTTEGQQAFMTGSSQYMMSLNESTLPEDSPYREIESLVEKGRTVPLVYVGWESLIVPLAQDIKELIEKKTDVEGLLASFDKTQEDIQKGDSDDIFAKVPQTLTLQETAKLCAIAEGKAVGADCAMVSLNEYREDGSVNTMGVSWYLYGGDASMELVNMIRPRETTISVLELTGAEIRQMQSGGFDVNENGKPFPYLLFTKEDQELAEDAVYKLAVSSGELTQDMAQKAQVVEVSPAAAIEQYMKERKTISADSLIWK